MHPCQLNYPCAYLSQSCNKCALPRCVVHHVNIEGRAGEFAYDELTGRITPWITVERKPVRNVDALESWFEDFSRRQLEDMMSTADTYERVHGRLRPKRHAVR